jgi:hypothetical protein
MDIRVKGLWTSALRSGQYKQGKECLRDEDDKFCCLGVLCDLYAKEHPEAKWVMGAFFDAQPADGAWTLLPPPGVQRWADLGTHDPRVKDYRSLSQLNDTGSTFVEIADMIEEYL